ncbi:hypothetical protein [Desulfobacca acetoxidans]|uniref:Uncharacterized protein n=1 Tax=Desulfobacca acetoxidans (strain ATCC 700848 / DSM 11109 / ASRB2) TaxID=880072 RepID=F2NDQ3_DESAR|nr:hypothetical protein [Desulfobacca acetoxidans]AEB10400.1 hypothetical protein Desac_2582 [Desulfobacca acetoxidans DSM 11109]
MSRYMQITVTVRPYYQPDLAAAFPRLARHLGFLNPDIAQANPSLFDLAGQVDKLLYSYDGTPLREILLRHHKTIRQLHQDIEVNIADWNLAAADRLLYRLEDIFDRLESELDSVPL